MSHVTTTIDAQLFYNACRGMDCTIPEESIAALRQYTALLLQWNSVMNLVGTRTWQDTLEVLLADSFYLAPFLQTLLPATDIHTWDLGAGAGLPGIPLRMVWQTGAYTLVEVREKRALFLANVLAQIPLPATHVYHGRVEDFCKKAPRAADVIISRAFMPWKKLLQLVHGAIAVGGYCIFLLREPAPDTVPYGWHCVATKAYIVRDQTRWFWALQRADKV